jgi:hypothetical protein
MTHPTQKKMRRSSARKTTSPGCASWPREDLHGTSLTPTLISEDLSFESLSLKVVELENALCNQDKFLFKVFHENKKLNLELENSCSEIASLRSVHDDMSAKPCDNCKMIMVNYVDLWLVHTKVAS